MSNATYLGRNIRSFKSSPQFDGFSRVVIVVSDEIEYSAGTETGRTLRLTCPWGTPQMAENILQDVRGFQYQPYTADGAIIDPSVELGDGVTANNVYGGVYTQNIKFGPLLTATVAAPEDEEINHEYPYKSKPNKEITREAKMLRASLAIEAAKIAAEVKARTEADAEINSTLELQTGQIAAKVSKTGGSASSFGWILTDTDWTIQANNRDILKATKSGLEVYGKVTATSGKIGGFDILSDYLSYNNQTFGGTNSKGIYIGVSGIQLGKYFKVDSSGNLTARSGRFEGTVYAGRIEYDDEDKGRLNGSALGYNTLSGSRLKYNTVDSNYVSKGINAGVAGGNWATDVFNGDDRADYIKTSVLIVGSTQFTKQTMTFVDYYGNTRSITALMVASE